MKGRATALSTRAACAAGAQVGGSWATPSAALSCPDLSCTAAGAGCLLPALALHTWCVCGCCQHVLDESLGRHMLFFASWRCKLSVCCIVSVASTALESKALEACSQRGHLYCNSGCRVRHCCCCLGSRVRALRLSLQRERCQMVGLQPPFRGNRGRIMRTWETGLPAYLPACFPLCSCLYACLPAHLMAARAVSCQLAPQNCYM